MMKAKTVFHNQRGFSLLEVVMGLGLSTLLVLAIYVFYSSFNKQIVDLSNEIEIATDIESGQRIMLKDLKMVDTSFGIITVEDDAGKPFFEYFPDVPENEIPAPVSRTITLKQNGKHELVLLLHDQNAHSIPTLNYDPSWAYQITAAGSNPEGTVQFRHVNWAQAGTGGHGNMISELRRRETDPSSGHVLTPGFWNQGQLLMFDMTSNFRLPAQMGERNKFAPRPPFFVGRVAGSDTGKVAADDAGFTIDNEVKKYVNIKHPLNDSYDNDSANAFLWGVPGTSGGMPSVRLRPVKLVKYYVKQMYPTHAEEKMRQLVQLYRQTLTNGKWEDKKNNFLIAEKLKSVQFRRNSVTDKSVLFEISRSEL